MTKEDRREYHTNKKKEWRAKHPERYKTQTKKDNDLLRYRISEVKEGINEWLSWVPCSMCGMEDWRYYQFHHEDASEKDCEISTMIQKRRPLEVLFAEIDKCEILCYVCHKIKHGGKFERSGCGV